MKLRIAQLFVSQNIQENLNKVLEVIAQARPEEWILFPEGMISGYYPEDAEYLAKLDTSRITSAIEQIKSTATEKTVHVVIGTAYKESDQWYNVSLLIDNDGVRVYRKNNLSTLDRDHFAQGSQIDTFSDKDTVLGVQMCRELVYPEQWRLLRMKGAEVIFHINNAVKPDDKKREALLISRAFENQCWVCSVNNAAPSQTMRSMVINPVGDVIWASEPTQEEVKAIDLDLTEIQNVYIEQARTDLVSIKEPE